MPASPSTDSVTSWLAGFSQACAEAAGHAVVALLASFGQSTEPDFHSIVPAYDKMLAIALLIAGGVIAFALAEQMLGGERGAGWTVIPRVLACTVIACTGLVVVRYFAAYTALLASAWNLDFIAQSASLRHSAEAAYSTHAVTGQGFDTTLGLILTWLLTVALALLVYLELVLRSAVILVTTTFVPFVVVLAIWPRLVGAALHLAEFLAAVLLSKFFMATAIYVGYALVAKGLAGTDHTLMSGLAVLSVAVFAPVLLFQGIRFGQHRSAGLARTWAGSGSRSGVILAGVAMGGGRWAAGAIGRRTGLNGTLARARQRWSARIKRSNLPLSRATTGQVDKE